MSRKSSKNSIIWRHFNVEVRDKISHRRKGHCLHCLTKFHDCRFDVLLKHILFQCKSIPDSMKYEVETADAATSEQQVKTGGKRTAVELDSQDEENAPQALSGSEGDVQAAAELVRATWSHFNVGPRDNRNHRRVAECTHCRGICSNPRTERLQSHLLKFCKDISPVTREQYSTFCEALKGFKKSASDSYTSMNAQMLASTDMYGALSDASSAALASSFGAPAAQGTSQYAALMTQRLTAESIMSHLKMPNLSADSLLDASRQDSSNRQYNFIEPYKWRHTDFFEDFGASSRDPFDTDRCSNDSQVSPSQSCSDMSGKLDDALIVNKCSKMKSKFVCRQCRAEFTCTADAAILKDHILYVCIGVPKDRLARLVESEFASPV